MIFDSQALFSDAQAITATAASENVIDLGEPGTPKHAAAAITQDLGRGRPVPIRVQVVEDFATLTSLAVAIQTSSSEGSGYSDVATRSIDLADLKAGAVVSLDYVPRGVDERYVRLNYTVTGTNATAGKITAGLVFGNETWKP